MLDRTTTSDAARYVSGCGPRTPAASRTTRTTVWMAMPPRMLPTATPTLPDRAALATIAVSGRFVPSASRMSPPRADPRPSRVDSTSVWFESWTPATQIAAAAAAKMSNSTGVPSDEIPGRYPEPCLAIRRSATEHRFW
jgi:hypothetical protein